MDDLLKKIINAPDDISNSERNELNSQIRNKVEEVISYKPPLTDREKEIIKLCEEEKQDYEIRKEEFYANPLHWTNNKRRQHGLPTLRGSKNKYRSLKFPAFHPTVRMFAAIEEVIDETITNAFKTNDYFGTFAEIKDLKA